MPPTKKCDSQCQSLLKNKGIVYLKVTQIKNNGKILPLIPNPFKTLTNTHTHSCLPFAKSGQVQNMPVRDTVFWKNGSPWLSIPSHSSAFGHLPLIRVCLDRSHSSQYLQPCCHVLQLLITVWHLFIHQISWWAGGGSSWQTLSTPYQSTWQMQKAPTMAAMPSLNPGPELQVLYHFQLCP